MAAILQLRQGSTSTYISQGPNIAEPFFDTGSNILIVGKSATEVIKLTKLDESNAGSFSITGDYTGSNLYLSGDLTASNANLSGDITIGGNIILGDAVQDNITISGQFDSDLIPSASGEYDLGSTTKKWNHLYAVSASIDSIDIAPNLPSGVVSSSAQISTLGFDNYQYWNATADNAVNLSINRFTTLDFEGGGGITTEARNPGNLFVTITLDTGSNHFISGAQDASLNALPQGTVSGSQQVIDLLPSGVISGSTQLPSGLISGSSQVTDGSGIVSGSQQVYFTEITGLPTLISGSPQILDGSGILSSSNETFNTYSQSVDNLINNLNSVSHSHSNKSNLDTINQDLGTTDDVQFNSFQAEFIQSNGDLNISGTSSFDSNVTIYGDLTIFGTESIVNSDNLSIADNMIYLNSGSTITNPDLGFAGNYNDGTYAHAGLFRDASDSGIWKFYEGYTPEPEGSIDTSHVTFALAPLQVESLDASLVTSENYIGTGSQLVFPGTNLISSSQQVIDFLPTGTVSGSAQITNGSNLISSSQQVIDFLPTGTVSGSIQVLGGTNIVSSSVQVTNFLPSGTISGSTQVIEILEVQTPGLVSGSDQVTASLDLRYASLGGNDLLSSSNETFEEYSSSVDTRLLDTLSSGSDTSQSLHVLVGNFPTSGSLGTSAFYNVSSSLADDPSVIPNVKAVYDYINNTIGAADITGVSASLGLFGGGDTGYVSLSLDTGSAHFQAGVELYSSTLPSGVISGSSQIITILDDNTVISGSSQVTDIAISQIDEASIIDSTETWLGVDSRLTTPGAIDKRINDKGIVSSSLQITGIQFSQIDPDSIILSTEAWPANDARLTTPGAIDKRFDTKGLFSGSEQVTIDMTNIDGGALLDSTELWISVDSRITTPAAIDKRIDSKGIISGSSQVSSLLPSGVVSSSAQTVDHIESSTLIAINQSSPSSIGAVGEIIINGTTNGYSGVITLESGSTTVYNQYATESDKMINFLASAGYGLFLQPDNNSSKAWVIDTDGDFVSQGTGDVYTENLYSTNAISGSSLSLASDATIAGNVNITGTLTADSISGDLTSQLPSGVVSGSQQVKDLGFVDLSSVQTISGTKTFTDIVVNGTGSFARLDSVTGTAKIIGDAFIVLNNDTPTERYAGIKVYDSGSTNTTASLQFDGQTNDWFYEYSDDGGVTTDHGVVLFGPEYSGIGSPTYPTNNRVQKGNGGHHLLDSNITDTGTTITLGSNTNVSGVLTATTFKGMISGSSQVTIGGDATGSANDINVVAINGVTITNAEATQLGNIGTTTISNTQWGYLGGLNQALTTTSDVDFGGVDIRDAGPTLILRDTDTSVLQNQVLGQIKFLHSDSGGGFSEVGVIKSVATEDFAGVDADSYKIHIDSNTIVNGSLESTGDIVAYASSDRRLKDEIQPISDSISKINQIGGYSFVWNTEKQNIYNGKDYGVIAQEIEEILPELVNTRENGYKAVKYDKLVSLLIEGIKELSNEIEELKKKIN